LFEEALGDHKSSKHKQNSMLLSRYLCVKIYSILVDVFGKKELILCHATAVNIKGETQNLEPHPSCFCNNISKLQIL